MEEVTITTQLDKLIKRVEALSEDVREPGRRFRVVRTRKDTKYNTEYCVNIYHKDLLILRRCVSRDLSLLEIDNLLIWEDIDLEVLTEFMMYAIFGKQNMIDETVTLRKSKYDAR